MCTVTSLLDWEWKVTPNWPIPYWNLSIGSRVTEKSLICQLICTALKLIWPHHWTWLAKLCQINPSDVKIHSIGGSSTTHREKKILICTFEDLRRPNQWLSWHLLNSQDAFYQRAFQLEVAWKSYTGCPRKKYPVFAGLEGKWANIGYFFLGHPVAIFLKTLWRLSCFIESFSGKFKDTMFFGLSQGFRNGKPILCRIKIDWAMIENSSSQK